MAKMALKRETENMLFMPDTISGAGGAIRLNAKDDMRRSLVVEEKSKSCPCWKYKKDWLDYIMNKGVRIVKCDKKVNNF